MAGSSVDGTDEQFLRRAIALATEAAAAGDRPFGSLLVADGEVLVEDQSTANRDRDVAAHPELKLARWAARELDRESARRTTMYTSTQPCPMCTEAIRRSGLGRVVFALSSDQLAGLLPDDVGPEPELAGPALFDEARAPFARRASSPDA